MIKLMTKQKVVPIGFMPKVVEIIGSTALEAMLMEAACAPSPGLVDRFNSGAHRDMDIFTFIQSSAALAPGMYSCAMAAWEHEGPREAILPTLRLVGAEAEKSMFNATKGVNTQKGLLFLMGIMVVASVLAVKAGKQRHIAQSIGKIAADVCKNIVERELKSLHGRPPKCRLTAGERLYLTYGVTGIRGEIENGLPAVFGKGLPGLIDGINRGLSLNNALIHSLLALMTVVEDTTILHRHNLDVLKAVQQDAAGILEEGGMFTKIGREMTRKLDQKYIERNISPGGSADLLAITYFLYAIEKRIGSQLTCF